MNIWRIGAVLSSFFCEIFEIRLHTMYFINKQRVKLTDISSFSCDWGCADRLREIKEKPPVLSPVRDLAFWRRPNQSFFLNPSFKATDRLKTGALGRESKLSTQK